MGLSGMSGDVRDLEAAAARATREHGWRSMSSSAAIRHYLGAYLVELGGADVIVFTGGIGENGARIRAAVCAGPGRAGHRARRRRERRRPRAKSPIHAAASRTQVWVVPTNEEIVVARQAKATFGQGRVSIMFVAKVTGSVVATQKVDSMVGHKLLSSSPIGSMPTTANGWSTHRPNLRRGRHGRRRRRANSC